MDSHELIVFFLWIGVRLRPLVITMQRARTTISPNDRNGGVHSLTESHAALNPRAPASFTIPTSADPPMQLEFMMT